jgi:hypothetical protein
MLQQQCLVHCRFGVISKVAAAAAEPSFVTGGTSSPVSKGLSQQSVHVAAAIQLAVARDDSAGHTVRALHVCTGCCMRVCGASDCVALLGLSAVLCVVWWVVQQHCATVQPAAQQCCAVVVHVCACACATHPATSRPLLALCWPLRDCCWWVICSLLYVCFLVRVYEFDQQHVLAKVHRSGSCVLRSMAWCACGCQTLGMHIHAHKPCASCAHRSTTWRLCAASRRKGKSQAGTETCPQSGVCHKLAQAVRRRLQTVAGGCC